MKDDYQCVLLLLAYMLLNPCINISNTLGVYNSYEIVANFINDFKTAYKTDYQKCLQNKE